MGDQTDYLAQFMNSEQAGKILDIDLDHAPADCNLVESIARIAQGSIGAFIAEAGGFEGLVRVHTSSAYRDMWRRDRENMIEDITNDIKDELTNFVMDLIKSEIRERVKPKTNLDDLRERVENFSLVGLTRE